MSGDKFHLHLSPYPIPLLPTAQYTSGVVRKREGTGCVEKGSYTNYPVPFCALGVSFSSWRAGLVLTISERKKTIVEVERKMDERPEVRAKNLVRVLKGWKANNG